MQKRDYIRIKDQLNAINENMSIYDIEMIMCNIIKKIYEIDNTDLLNLKELMYNLYQVPTKPTIIFDIILLSTIKSLQTLMDSYTFKNDASCDSLLSKACIIRDLEIYKNDLKYKLYKVLDNNQSKKDKSYINKIQNSFNEAIDICTNEFTEYNKIKHIIIKFIEYLKNILFTHTLI